MKGFATAKCFIDVQSSESGTQVSVETQIVS